MSAVYLIIVGLLIVCSYHHASTKTDFLRCLRNQFKCEKGNECIPIHRRCDADLKRSLGCSDQSHEKGCDKHRCLNGEHRCGNGFCIPASRVCDGRIDCFDRSDEKDCAPFTDPICLRNEFRCSNGKCISILQRCDGQGACFDGSDETTLCSTWCPEGYVLCNNTAKSVTRKCIPKSYICNGETDCPDESDEKNCDKCENWGCSQGCKDNAAHGPMCTCKKGYELDVQDERTCKFIARPVRCLRNEFACRDGKKCIPIRYRSNIELNLTLGCADGSHTANFKLPCVVEGEHMCGDGVCIPAAWVCDGFPNCNDESDEENCKKDSYITDFQCLRNQFRCLSKEPVLCIPIRMRCDGIFSAIGACPDHSDEFECDENWCPEGYLRCDKKMDDGTKNCIPKSRFCDGEPDCKDGSDEKDCDKCENWGCEEFCKETLPWPECFCKEGSKLNVKDKSKRTCELIEKGYNLTSDCDALIRSKESWIFTPNYPSNYDNFAKCQFVVEKLTPDTCKVEMTLRHFDLENSTDCIKDVLDLKDGQQEKICAKWDSGTKMKLKFKDYRSTMILVFQSDEDTTRKGFMIHLKQLPRSC